MTTAETETLTVAHDPSASTRLYAENEKWAPIIQAAGLTAD